MIGNRSGPQARTALASPGARVYNPAMAATRPKPVVLCVLDGWGHREETGSNAIALAATPALDRLRADAPHALLGAASTDVGLPPGQIGNSEVGHMNLGAGRVVLQDLPRADAAIADGSLFESPVFVDLAAALEASGGTCHVLGLLSPGGVHAHQAHIAAMVRALAARGLAVAVHAFLDGRDTPPRSAQGFLDDFMAAIAGAEGAAVATVSGRYYAMDRDRRWPRVERAHAAIAHGQGARAASAADALARADAADIGDEFVAPTVVGGYGGMRDGDGLVMMNFRADRVREILSALVDPDFAGFRRARPAALAGAVGLTSYSADLDRRLGVLLPPRNPTSTLGEVLARAGLTQLRIAETEKYAHVTFFFNGGREESFAGEERILVPSPKVATYDRKPEMAAREVADRLVAAIAGGRFDFILANFANTDMVGHTGVLRGGGPRGRDGRCVHRPHRRCGRARRRRVDRHRRPRQRRADVRRGHRPGSYRAHDASGSVPVDPRAGARARIAGGAARRPRADRARPAGHRQARRNDRPVVDRRRPPAGRGGRGIAGPCSGGRQPSSASRAPPCRRPRGGRLLPIAHGERYHAPVAGLSRIDATLGQTPLAGGPVGRMAERDGTNAILYLELRRNGVPFDPPPWLAALEREAPG